MSDESWLRRNKDAFTVGLLVALVGVVAGSAWQMGSQSEAISNLRNGQANLSAEIDAQTAELKAEITIMEGGFDGLANRMDKRFDGINMRLNDIRISINADQADLSKVMISMGIVEKDDVFHAAVIDKNIWLFPSPLLAARFDARGYKREQVSPYLYGIKLMPVSAITLE